MNMKVLAVVLLAILVVMSFVQGVQINNLEESLKGIELGAVQKGTGSPAPGYTGSTGNAPAMVGGC